MRIGLLFLVLQSVLLCATAQAEPGVSQKPQTAAAGVLESSPGDTGTPLPPGGDGDLELQRAAAGVFSASAVPGATLVFPCSPLPGRARTANIIRGPPALA